MHRNPKPVKKQEDLPARLELAPVCEIGGGRFDWIMPNICPPAHAVPGVVNDSINILQHIDYIKYYFSQ